jgi:DNA repair protein RAD16
LDYSATLGNVLCPTCSIPITVDFTTESSREKVPANLKGSKRSGILDRLQSLADFKTSTKIDALVSEKIILYVDMLYMYYVGKWIFCQEAQTIF